MDAELRSEVMALIWFYEMRGWDWSSAVAFTIAKYKGWK